MLFGPENAPLSLQRAVDSIVSRLKWPIALVCLHDLIVYSEFVTKHLVHVRTVLAVLQNAGVALKLSECSFSEIRFRT